MVNKLNVEVKENLPRPYPAHARRTLDLTQLRLPKFPQRPPNRRFETVISCPGRGVAWRWPLQPPLAAARIAEAVGNSVSQDVDARPVDVGALVDMNVYRGGASATSLCWGYDFFPTMDNCELGGTEWTGHHATRGVTPRAPSWGSRTTFT